MADFTGFDPEQSKSDIHQLDSVLWDCRNKLHKTVPEFFYSLTEVWASPKAVEFGNTYMTRFNDLLQDFSRRHIVIMQNVIRAISTVARANGYPDFYYDYVLDPELSYYFDFKEEKDGIVGMNIMQALLYKDEFNQNVDKFNNALNELDFQNIALYDPEGLQQAAYKEELRQFKETFNELITEINEAVSIAFEEETNEIRLAKEQATQTMSA